MYKTLLLLKKIFICHSYWSLEIPQLSVSVDFCVFFALFFQILPLYFWKMEIPPSFLDNVRVQEGFLPKHNLCQVLATKKDFFSPNLGGNS